MTDSTVRGEAWRCAGALAAIGLMLGSGACGGMNASGIRSSAESSSVLRASNTATMPTVTSRIPQGQHVRGDGDADNPSDIDGNGDSDSVAGGGPDNDSDGPTPASYAFPDGDDRPVFAYGRRPTAKAARAITGVVRDYYAAASAQDGAQACPLLLASIARAAAQEYGRPGGPQYLRGATTCQAVLSMLFRHFHAELAGAVNVVAIRLRGGSAQVVLSSRTLRASSVVVNREGRAWKIVGLLAQPLP